MERVARLYRQQKKRGKPLTARELYQLIVGEAGISPDYFLREMGPAEATDFVEGYSRRQHPAWEQTRMLADVVCKVLGGSETGIEFPWENEKSEVSPDDERERIAELRRIAKKIEKQL